MPVVVVPVHDQVAAGQPDALVSLGAQRETLGETDVPDLRLLGNQVRDIIVAVVQDDQFFVGIILAQEVSDRPRDKLPSVVCRHDAGDQGRAVHRFASRVGSQGHVKLVAFVRVRAGGVAHPVRIGEKEVLQIFRCKADCLRAEVLADLQERLGKV
jgi:hypothetical protein